MRCNLDFNKNANKTESKSGSTDARAIFNWIDNLEWMFLQHNYSQVVEILWFHFIEYAERVLIFLLPSASLLALCLFVEGVCFTTICRNGTQICLPYYTPISPLAHMYYSYDGVFSVPLSLPLSFFLSLWSDFFSFGSLIYRLHVWISEAVSFYLVVIHYRSVQLSNHIILSKDSFAPVWCFSFRFRLMNANNIVNKDWYHVLYHSVACTTYAVLQFL